MIPNNLTVGITPNYQPHILRIPKLVNYRQMYEIYIPRMRCSYMHGKLNGHCEIINAYYCLCSEQVMNILLLLVN